jgi:hypothetical protein
MWNRGQYSMIINVVCLYKSFVGVILFNFQHTYFFIITFHKELAAILILI